MSERVIFYRIRIGHEKLVEVKTPHEAIDIVRVLPVGVEWIAHMVTESDVTDKLRQAMKSGIA